MKDKVEQKIRELVPELMELSFGCEVVTKMGHNILVKLDRTIVGADRGDGQVWTTNYTTTKGEYCTVWDSSEIIGHPIHLEHILRAIEKVHGEKTHKEDKTGFTPFDRASLMYDLSKPLNEQSPELYTLLAEILNLK